MGSTKIKSISGFPRKLREAAASQNAANLLLDDTGADAEVVPLLVKTHKQRIRRRENQTRWIEEARTLKKAGDNLNYQVCSILDGNCLQASGKGAALLCIDRVHQPLLFSAEGLDV